MSECKAKKCDKVHDGSEPWHGTPTGYGYHGCRCDACSEQNSAALRDWRERNPEAITAYNDRNREKRVEYMRAYNEHRRRAPRDQVAALDQTTGNPEVQAEYRGVSLNDLLAAMSDAVRQLGELESSLRAECDALVEENGALRQRLAESTAA